LRDVDLMGCIDVLLGDRSVALRLASQSSALYSRATCGCLGCLAQTTFLVDFFLFEVNIRSFQSPSYRHLGAYGIRIWNDNQRPSRHLVYLTLSHLAKSRKCDWVSYGCISRVLGRGYRDWHTFGFCFTALKHCR
jgi:hypothetical protein